MGLRSKLLLIQVATAGAAFLSVTLMLLAREYVSQRRTLLPALQVQARMIGANSTATLLFDDPRGAHEILTALHASPAIVSARIYRASGELLAQFPEAAPRAADDLAIG